MKLVDACFLFLPICSTRTRDIAINECGPCNYFTAFESNSSNRAPRLQYVVITGQNYYRRATLLWNSWGKIICEPNAIIFITDGQYVSEVPFPYFIGIDIKESLSSIQKYRLSQYKWMAALLNIKKYIDFDWLVIVDDDTFVIHDALISLLKEQNFNDSILIGKKGADCHLMCGGAGLIFSKALIRKLSNNYTALKHAFKQGQGPHHRIHADVVLSYFVLNNNLGSLLHRNELKNFPPEVAMKWYLSKNHTPSTVVSFHHMTDEMSYQQTSSYYYHHYKHTVC